MIDRRAIPNPFDSDVVIDPDSPPRTDVPRIHEEAFRLCQKAWGRVSGGEGSWSVLLYGDAGCGKTHLLSKFRRWLSGEPGTTPGIPVGLFVAVRMETGPGHVWRHLRRRFVEELLRRKPGNGSDASTHLDAILNRYASRGGGDLAHAFDLAPVRDLGHDLMRVLEHFAAGVHRRLCRAWLTGDRISESDLLLLNLPQPSFESVDEDLAEYDARRIVLAITRLCVPAPVVFCFDQIEALGLSQQKNSYGAFSRLAASLIDEIETGNSLVISTILATFLRDLEDGSNATDYQRIANKDRADLQPLSRELGQQLLEARLKLVPELKGENPISEADLRDFHRAQHGQMTPRRLIHEARRLFARWQGEPEKPRILPDDFLRGEFEQLWSQAEVLAATGVADEVLSQGLPVALQLLGHKTQENSAKHVDLTAGSGAGKVLIAFGNHTNMTSFAAWLRKLKQQAAPGAAICVIRDERLSIGKTARVARQRLQEITETGGRVVRVDAEALGALDAMRRLLARATSGDLSLNGETIEPRTVREWLARNLPDAVGKFTAEILGDNQGGTENPPDALVELLDKRKVLPLTEAARLSELPVEQIENYARTHPNRIVLFGGVCPVVCQAIASPAQGEPSDAV